MGHFEKAVALLKPCLQLRERLYGKDSLLSAAVMNKLGAAYHQLGDVAQALNLLSQALEIRTRLLGANHPKSM